LELKLLNDPADALDLALSIGEMIFDVLPQQDRRFCAALRINSPFESSACVVSAIALKE
jgi:hypothetical protein